MRNHTCCDDLRGALACKFLIDTSHVGISFTVREDNLTKVVPFHFCPWCQAELAPKGDRAPPIAYP